MTALRTAAQQALEALQEYQSKGAPFLACDGAVAALRAALAQQDASEMYAAAYSSACGELRKVEAQRDALLELVAEMNQHEGVEWSEDLCIKINSALMQALEALAWKAGSEPALYGAQTLQAITALRATLAQQDEPETCTWHQDGDSDSGVYATSCGHYFNLEDGTPEDNKMQWCCYCGKKLVQELITEDDDD